MGAQRWELGGKVADVPRVPVSDSQLPQRPGPGKAAVRAKPAAPQAWEQQQTPAGETVRKRSCHRDAPWDKPAHACTRMHTRVLPGMSRNHSQAFSAQPLVPGGGEAHLLTEFTPT